MAIITIELPDHLVEDFLDWMSNQGEQDFMEAYHNEPREMGGVTVNYPGWKDKIVITEYEKDE